MPMAYDGKKDPKAGYKSKNFIASLEFALVGFQTLFKEERNMRIHTLLGSLALLAGLVFKLSKSEWLWLLLVIFLVMVMEMLNTTAENIVDMVTHYHFNPIGKKVKDIAAAAVLFTAGFAVIVGLIIFGPKIWQLFC